MATEKQIKYFYSLLKRYIGKLKFNEEYYKKCPQKDYVLRIKQALEDEDEKEKITKEYISVAINNMKNYIESN